MKLSDDDGRWAPAALTAKPGSARRKAALGKGERGCVAPVPCRAWRLLPRERAQKLDAQSGLEARVCIDRRLQQVKHTSGWHLHPWSYLYLRSRRATRCSPTARRNGTCHHPRTPRMVQPVPCWSCSQQDMPRADKTRWSSPGLGSRDSRPRRIV